jgi:hypothetical protein
MAKEFFKRQLLQPYLIMVLTSNSFVNVDTFSDLRANDNRRQIFFPWGWYFRSDYPG